MSNKYNFSERLRKCFSKLNETTLDSFIFDSEGDFVNFSGKFNSIDEKLIYELLGLKTDTKKIRNPMYGEFWEGDKIFYRVVEYRKGDKIDNIDDLELLHSDVGPIGRYREGKRFKDKDIGVLNDILTKYDVALVLIDRVHHEEENYIFTFVSTRWLAITRKPYSHSKGRSINRVFDFHFTDNLSSLFRGLLDDSVIITDRNYNFIDSYNISRENYNIEITRSPGTRVNPFLIIPRLSNSIRSVQFVNCDSNNKTIRKLLRILNLIGGSTYSGGSSISAVNNYRGLLITLKDKGEIFISTSFIAPIIVDYHYADDLLDGKGRSIMSGIVKIDPVTKDCNIIKCDPDAWYKNHNTFRNS